jgi:hypothetical protein
MHCSSADPGRKCLRQRAKLYRIREHDLSGACDCWCNHWDCRDGQDWCGRSQAGNRVWDEDLARCSHTHTLARLMFLLLPCTLYKPQPDPNLTPNPNPRYHNRSRNLEGEAETGAVKVELNALLEASDYVVLVCPSTAETRCA